MQVEASDLGNNFLLDSNSLGKSRAQCVTELLKELNPLVHGSFVEDSAANLLETTPDFFTGFQLVIATQVRHLLLLPWQAIHFTSGNNAACVSQVQERVAIELDAVCRRLGVMLIIARSFGLVGYLRVSNRDCKGLSPHMEGVHAWS